MLKNLVQRAALPRANASTLARGLPSLQLSHSRCFVSADPKLTATRVRWFSADPKATAAKSRAKTILGLTKSGEQLLKEGRYKEAFERFDMACEASDKFQMWIEVQEHPDEPIKLTPLSYLWNDFSDSRWMEPAPTAISEEHLNSILAVTNQMTRGLERVIEPPVEVVIAPSGVGSHFAHYV
jgi:hypothetical protein